MKRQLSERSILATFTAGHIVDDIYMNALPPFLPVLIASSGLSYASAGLLVTFFTLTSSVSQPFLGYAIDRYRVKWVSAVGLIWAGIFVGLMGTAKSYGMLLILATLAGIGPAMFHPHALSAISGLSTGAKGRIMSVFIIGGNIGFAISPVLIGALTSSMGQGGMFYMAIPGILMGSLIWKLSSGMSTGTVREMHPFRLSDLRPAVILIMVAVLRSWVYFSVLSYLPSYFVQGGRSVLRSNSLLSIMLLAGVAGQFIGGTLSDRFGRKQVTLASLLLAAPLLLAFLHTTGPASLAFLFCFGFSVMASFSVTMVMMHQIMHRHIGMASGIMIGFALGIGGIGVMITGLMADSFGLFTALNTLVMVLVVAAIMIRFVPGAR
ncbi:MAG: MFS transporter, partial [Nitrospirota bacterium]|nr:MFS transporter [Nitrospirota bacterium]